MKKIFWLFISLVVVISSCSDELTRDKARKMIMEKYHYPKPVIGSLSIHADGNRVDGAVAELYEAEKLGLANYKILHPNQFFYREVRGYLTKKGKKYLLDAKDNYVKVRRATLRFNEITGIRFNDAKNQATVEYTVNITDITPFGKISMWDGGCNDYKDFKCKEKTVNETANFVKYDDGWRIK